MSLALDMFRQIQTLLNDGEDEVAIEVVRRTILVLEVTAPIPLPPSSVEDIDDQLFVEVVDDEY